MRLTSRLIQLALLAVSMCALARTASAETIATCVSSSGSIHVATNAGCGSNQQLVIWNVVGPQGPPGPPGPSGAAGAIGPAGVAGVQGAVGPVGPIGIEGSRGPVGPAGPSGAVGLPGVTGPIGERGLQGVPGPAGPVGVDGPIGIVGDVGPPGDPNGPAGPPGDPGPSGAGWPLIYDANGLLVGKYVDNGGPGAIVTRGEDRFYLNLDGRLAYRPMFGLFYYLTPDCSDAPYTGSFGSPIVPLMATGISNLVAWVPQLGEPTITIPPGQTYYTRTSNPFDPHADLGPCTARTLTTPVSVFPAKGYDISAFAFPFRIGTN
ncbi:MAG TPA: hypothetical protein VF456_26040 [Vicinamibacterales bacterium]